MSNDPVIEAQERRTNIALSGMDVSRPIYERLQSEIAKRTDYFMVSAQHKDTKATALYSSTSTVEVNKLIAQVQRDIEDSTTLIDQLQIRVPRETLEVLQTAVAAARDAQAVEEAKVQAAEARKEKIFADLEVAENAVKAARAAAGLRGGKTRELTQAISHHLGIFGDVVAA